MKLTNSRSSLLIATLMPLCISDAVAAPPQTSGSMQLVEPHGPEDWGGYFSTENGRPTAMLMQDAIGAPSGSTVDISCSSTERRLRFDLAAPPGKLPQAHGERKLVYTLTLDAGQPEALPLRTDDAELAYLDGNALEPFVMRMAQAESLKISVGLSEGKTFTRVFRLRGIRPYLGKLRTACRFGERP